MSDDLRLRATVVDNASGPIRDIGRTLRTVARTGSLAPLQREFAGTHRALSLLANEIRSVTVPALGALGLGGGSAALALFGVARAVDALAGKTLDLRYFGREIGMATGSIKSFTAAAEKVRIAPEAARQGLATFNKNVEDLKLNLPGLRDELLNMGGREVVGKLQGSRDTLDAIAKALEYVQRLNPAQGRRLAERLFGNADFARLSVARLRAELGKFKDTTDAEEEAARKLNDNLVAMRGELTSLGRTVGNEVLPPLTELVKEINKFLAADTTKAGIKVYFEELRDILRDIGNGDWGKLAGEWWNRFTTNPFYSPPPDRGAAAKAQANKVAEIERQIAEREGALGAFDREQADRGRALGDLPPKLADRRRWLTEEIDLLKDQLRKLRLEMEKTNGIAKKMSFDGGGSGVGFGPGPTAPVVKASLGGQGGTVAMRGLGGLPAIPGGTAGGGDGSGLAGTPSGPGGMPSGSLADARKAFGEELKDPAVRERLMRLTAAENPENPQAFMESVMNRAAARGQSLRQAINDSRYYPAVSMAGKDPGRHRNSFGRAIDDVLGGSNITNFATGNASLNVGFGYGRGAGDPYTYRTPNGERYGIENHSADRRWADRMRGAGAGSGPASGAKPFGGPGNIGGLRADFVDQLSALRDLYRRDTGRADDPFTVTDGYRSHAAQAALYRRKPGLAAPPGRSHHGDRPDGTGRDAADLKYASPAARAWIHANAGRVGLRFPMGYEPWHIQAAESRRGGETYAEREARRRRETASSPAFPRGVTPDDGRARMDKALKTMGGTLTGSATLDVNVTGPKGTVVRGSADGMFRDFKIHRGAQMTPAPQGPAGSEE